MEDGNRTVKALIFWEGFPACGLLVKKVLDVYADNVIFIATKPVVPFQGLEAILDHDVIWLDKPDDIWAKRFNFSDRNLVIHTGWNHKGWIKYDKFVKKKNSAKIVVVSDNKFTGTFRQYLGALYFRLNFSQVFDAAFVPGKSGVKLLEFFGMPTEKIVTGNYGAHESLYHVTKDFVHRKNEFLYVGQLNHRKSTDILIEGFKQYRNNGGRWNLRILGSGPLDSLCSGEGIVNDGFTQPHKVSAYMNSAKVLVLVSRHDNWGTVVCEAAACGMNLLLSKHVGACEDILEESVNGQTLGGLSADDVCNSFFDFEQMSDDHMAFGSKRSIEIAAGYRSDNYFYAFQKFIKQFGLKERKLD
jgi:glycosyltransferase involved in cell wall biosynthesis